jgi:hypothetical protein
MPRPGLERLWHRQTRTSTDEHGDRVDAEHSMPNEPIFFGTAAQDAIACVPSGRPQKKVVRAH